MQKIIITGGFGFVGKNFIEHFAEKYELVIIDKNIDQSFLKSNPVKYYEYDFVDPDLLRSIFNQENPDFIINLISIVSAERNLDIFDKLLDVNFKIFLKIYEASKDLKSLKLLINFGSAEEYGSIETPFKEADREEPSSPYALVKQFTSNTAIMLNRNYNYPVCVIRPGNLFGKYQDSSKIMPYIIAKLRNNENIDLTPGEQKRDFIYIHDFCKGIEIVLDNYSISLGNIINIASGESHSIKNIVEHIRDKLKSSSIVNYGAFPYRENEMMDFKCDIRFLNNLVASKFTVNFFDSLDFYIEEFVN